MAKDVTCNFAAGDPQVGNRLCQKMTALLPASDGRALELVVSAATQTSLRAKLVVTGPGPRIDGPELSTSIIDRASFPDSALERFAKTLLTSIDGK